MRKLLLILPIVLLGCAELSKIYAPSKTVHNEECVEIQMYEIFQVLENGALANACGYKYGIETCNGLVVFVPAQKGEDFYDDKIIMPADGKCIVYDGVYKYTTKKEGNHKTVPKLKIVDKEISNPAYLEWMETQAIN